MRPPTRPMISVCSSSISRCLNVTRAHKSQRQRFSFAWSLGRDEFGFSRTMTLMMCVAPEGICKRRILCLKRLPTLVKCMPCIRTGRQRTLPTFFSNAPNVPQKLHSAGSRRALSSPPYFQYSLQLKVYRGTVPSLHAFTRPRWQAAARVRKWLSLISWRLT